MYGGQRPPSYSNNPRSSLEQYQGIQRQLDGDIYATNKEIHTLNNKIVKNDYDHTQLMKLQQRHNALINKRKELEEAIRNQEYMQRQMAALKVNEQTVKRDLGKEYLQLGEERKRRAEEEKRRAIEQERMMHEANRRALEEDYIRKKQIMEEQKRQALEELAMREEKKRRERQQQERDKDQYNKKVMLRNQLETQKDSVYKQYYNQFMENQNTLHNIYRNKAAISDREKEQHRAEFQRKEMEEFQQRVAREQEDRAHKMVHEKDMLRSFLQSQIEEKTRRKSREREEELNYQSQVSRYQMNAAEAEQIERARRKQEQHRYDQDLKAQTRMSRIQSYNSPHQEFRQSHNPITNPIGFKIDVTNPYLIREYEHAKEKHLGDPNSLKVRNLAMVGNATLRHS